MIKNLFIITFSLFITSSFACNLESNKEIQDCINNTTRMIEMPSCIKKEYTSCDKLLNEEYKNAMKRANSKQKIQLRDMERLWLKFIDLHCSINHNSDNIAFRTKADECRIWETKQRIKELKTYFPQN